MGTLTEAAQTALRIAASVSGSMGVPSPYLVVVIIIMAHVWDGGTLG